MRFRCGGERNIANRLQRPPGEFVFIFGRGGFGPDGALIDPGSQDADLFAGELRSFRGHLHAVDLTGDELNQRAVGTFLRHDVGSIGGSFRERDLANIKSIFAFLQQRPMTFDARGREDRLDVFDEIDLASGGWRKLFSAREVRIAEYHAANDEATNERKVAHTLNYQLPGGFSSSRFTLYNPSDDIAG
jgi:hypothetical protein